MKGTLIKNSLKVTLAAASMSFMLMLTGGLTAKAEEVVAVPFEKMTDEDLHKAPGWETRNMTNNKTNWVYSNYIRDLLSKYDTITFKSGETFNLEYAINIPSGRNITINAEGATINITNTQKGAVANADFTKGGYGAIAGLTINGGIWKSTDSSGGKTSAFKIAQGKNITLKNMTIECANAGSHSVEIIACKDVLIENCKITPLGSNNGKEEQLQIDLASPATAGNVLSGKALDGSTCQNVQIINCEVTGNRGIGINADVKNAKGAGKKDRGKYQNKYHKNITISGCTITGNKAEGLMAYNIIGLKVTGNTIISKASAKKANYSSGIHALNQGGGNKMTVTIQNNTVEGGKQAIFVGSNGAKIKKATVTNNTVSNHSKNAVVAVVGCKSQKVKGNK
ncbi:right-handed parallel beta-helix repeat-containing protein [Butyrivibrio sp. AD3002]|uniref:right-handed parallel beta-helix repeat-containing protein n=1 Tax=Butyrivibrio sp. AD3002 TaxID=1280670 RepID=UPI0003B3F1C5|nr:right-handed parallel beta-helix repeat-containing protein [Butyrivibrio sp. AD3002]